MSKFINRSNRARLGLETLGLRAMPAVVVSQLDLDNDGGADDVLKSAFGGAQLDVAVKAGTGHDRVTVTTGKVEGSVVGVRMALGTGNDQGTVSFGKTDYGASVDVDAALGAGNNKFTAN